jgi:ABC-2 type transport system permease protein
MSVAEPVARPSRRVSTRFLRSELRLIAVRRRNQIGLAALAAVPIILAVALKVSAPPSGGAESADGPEFFSQILGNGFFVALAGLGVELTLFLPIAVATLAGDSIAGEANQGTLRYLLTVPVGRTRLLAVKYAGIVFGAFVAPLTVAASGLVTGLLLFGGGVTLLSGTQIGLAPAVLRLLGVCLYLGVCLAALGAVGLFLSTLTEQPMGATIALTMLTVASFVLLQIPQVDWLHPYLPTRYWQDFGELLRDPVSPGALAPGLLSAGAYILIFLTAAWARFGNRNITT